METTKVNKHEFLLVALVMILVLVLFMPRNVERWQKSAHLLEVEEAEASAFYVARYGNPDIDRRNGITADLIGVNIQAIACAGTVPLKK